MTNLRSKNNRGVAILFAVLLVSAVLAISLSLFNITYKQIILSQVALESKYATYAADSARDCALQWESFRGAGNPNPFGYFDVVNNVFVQPLATQLTCSEEVSDLEQDNCEAGGGGECRVSFVVRYPVQLGGGESRELCARVEVVRAKTLGAKPVIRAYGYNAAASGDNCPGTITDRTVERIIETK